MNDFKYIKQLAAFLAPIAMGGLAFTMVVGLRVLIPTNIAWLEDGDASSQYLGAAFFRNSPWTFPIGLNPSYGLEISNSIVYSDSNPLLAILFKLLRDLLPHVFQYFGFWLLICFILQAWFGWKLLNLVSRNFLICSFGAGMFVFAPPMLWRLHSNIGHLNLAGHFLILAALYLTFLPFRGYRHFLYWGALVVTASLIHSYLMAIVSLLWFVDLIDTRLKNYLTTKQLMIEFFSLIIVNIIFVWQIGYFAIGGSYGAPGFGAHGVNLLSIFDAGKPDYGLWSYILADIPGEGPSHEGFNYLGLGGIFLIPFALYAFKKNYSYVSAAIKRRSLFLISLFALVVFSLSNNIGIGPYHLEIKLYEPLLKVAAIFRASARMFWPAFYVILFGLMFLIIKKFSNKVAALILGCALLIQVVDTSAGWLSIRNKMMTEPSSTWTSPLSDPFWAQAAKHYKKIRIIPLSPTGQASGWRYLDQYALNYGLQTNAAYLGRVDAFAFKEIQEQVNIALASGNYDADSLYILDDEVLTTAVRERIRKEDLLLKINGLNVLAPGWMKCVKCKV